MVVTLKENNGSKEPLKRIAPFLEQRTKGLHDFITAFTARFFQILGLSEDFLNSNPSEWEHDEHYRRNKEVAQSIKVVNDLAKPGGVALFQESNSSLIRNEEQIQYLLQVSEDHKRSLQY